MSASTSVSKSDKYQDLEFRVARFTRDVISLIKSLPNSRVKELAEDQLIRSATSVGANYFEFTECVSKRDRICKLAISKKEAKESKFWLLVLYEEFPNHKNRIQELGNESQDLVKIFAAIIRNLN